MSNLIKHSGQVFTPDYLVKNILDESGYTGSEILRKHCIDNSCGDGAFLCEIVRRYIEAYFATNNSLEGVQSELAWFIHGIELDAVAYACCIDNLQSVFAEYGLSDCRIDLRHDNTLHVHDYNGKMDFVVGNPPYVRVHNLEENLPAVKSFSFAQDGMTDLYLVFFEIGFNMLKNGGRLCYITPSSWINSVAGTNLRNYIRIHQNLIAVIDLGHFQAFKSTTYTMISLFQKGIHSRTFAYCEYDSTTLSKHYICDIPFDKASINGCFYFADQATLEELHDILAKPSAKYVSVKNGFATLADKVFIASHFPFDKFVIAVLKASTGKWYKAFYPYDEQGHPISKELIFNEKSIADYLKAHKKELLKNSNEITNPLWYLYGRTQALKDVYEHKIAINAMIKDRKSIKLNPVPVGSGVYSGLYILCNASFKIIESIIVSDDFIQYVKSLKKYKSGGYYTFNSKDLELYLNFKISKWIQHGKISVEPINQPRLSKYPNTLF